MSLFDFLRHMSRRTCTKSQTSGRFSPNSVTFWFDFQFVKDCYEYCLTRPKLDQNWYGTIFLNNFSKLRYRDFFSKLYKTNTETHFPRMNFFETATKWGHWGRRGGMGLTIAVELFWNTHLLSLLFWKVEKRYPTFLTFTFTFSVILSRWLKNF